MFFFQRNSSPLFSVTRSSSFSVIHVSVNIKNNVEKDTTLLFFSLSKSPGGHPISFRINVELHLGCHTYWLSYFILACLWCGRTGGRLLGWTYRHVTTKFLRCIGYQIFLPSVLRARELHYYLTEHKRRQKRPEWITQLWSKSATTVDYYERNEGTDHAAM